MTSQADDAALNAKPRYHLEGQTSTEGPRWLIWDGVEGHFARYQNIADEGDAVALCAKLNADHARLTALNAELSERIEEGERLRERVRSEIINASETADFMAGVPIEAAHQRERWGSDHDAGKTPFDWFWLVGYLSQKAASAAVAGDAEKAKHHTISTAAALANWHAALSGADTSMRPGIADPEQEQAA